MDAARVVVIDDDTDYSDAIARRLVEEPGFDVIATPRTAAAGFSAARAYSPDVMTIDADIGGDDGIELAARILEAGCAARIAIVSGGDAGALALRAVRAGARAVVSKDAGADELIRVIRILVNGGSWMAPALLTTIFSELRSEHFTEDAKRLRRLTPRERMVLDGIVLGRDDEAIAHELHLSSNTVRSYMRHLFAKLDATSRREVINLVRRSGLASHSID